MSNENFYFSQEQWSVVTGSLLGDGCINKPKYGDSSFSKSQCTKHLEYLRWHKQLFLGKCNEISSYTNYAAGKPYTKHTLRLCSHPIFTDLRLKWYPNGKKIVPLDLQLDPLSVAIWFFDDGSNHLKGRCTKFATYCFTEQEVDFLSDQLLKKFSIECRTSKANVLCVKTESYKTLVDLVSPYMLWNCFKHKVAYRDSQLKFVSDCDARLMIELQASGMKLKDIAKKIGCSISVVSSMIRGERKKHLGQSRRKVALNNKSGFTGVSFDKSRNKWISSLRINGKTKKLGRFDSFEEAVEAIQVYKNGSVALPTSIYKDR